MVEMSDCDFRVQVSRIHVAGFDLNYQQNLTCFQSPPAAGQRSVTLIPEDPEGFKPRDMKDGPFFYPDNGGGLLPPPPTPPMLIHIQYGAGVTSETN